MPKVRHKKRTIPGELGTKLHLYHRHWEFTYSAPSDTGYKDFLDNDDLETCLFKNQLKIVGSSVLLYIAEGATSVEVDLHLPAKVTMVIIHKYGQRETFCFAKVGGLNHPSVFSGTELKNNQHKKRF